jgi:hypothetical protein
LIAAATGAAGVDRRQHGGEERVVRGQRAQHRGAPGERDQADPVAIELADQLGDLGLGAGEPVGRRVLGEHRPRGVEHEHDVGRGLHRGHGLGLAADLRPHHRADRGEHGAHQEAEPGQRPAERGLRGEPALHHRRQERAERAAAAQLEHAERDHGDQRDPHQVDALDLCELPVDHGSLRRTVPRSASAPTTSSIAAITNRA